MKTSVVRLSRRLLAMLMCLAMVLAFIPAQGVKAAASEGKTYTVIAGSDFQYSNSDHGIAGGHVRNILATIKNQGIESYDGLLFCGDYSQAFTAAASKEGVAYLKNVIAEELPTLRDDHKFFLQGNHDSDEETTDGTLTASGGHETEGYSVFAINEKDYMWYNDTEATILATAANLRSFLNAKSRVGYTKPIFIMSHMQLHYSMRTYESGDGKYANYLFDVINEAAGNGLNIIFLHAHNHSNGWDDYLGGSALYLAKGDSILIAQSSTTEFKQEKLNFTYMNAGYVGYYTRVNDGADNTLTMSVFQITDDQVTISRYSENGLHDLKSVGVTNAHKNETAYAPDTRVVPSPQTVILNKDIQATAVTGASVTGDGITSFEVLAGACQLPQGYSAYQTYQINAKGYTDGNDVTVTLPVDSSFDSSRPVLVLDHARGKTIALTISGHSVEFTVDHLGSFTVAQSNAPVVSTTQSVPAYFRTVPQGEYIQPGIPYVIADSGLDKTSHWVLTGTAVEKTVSSVTHTGLVLDELADAATSPVWYYDGTNVRLGAMDGQYLNISYTGDFNGDSSVGLVTVGDYNATTSAKVSHFGSGPSYNLYAGATDTRLYLAHRNSGSNSIASVYAKYNYNSALWYFNEVISTAKLTVAASSGVMTMKNTILLMPTVTAGSTTATDYTITWESGDPAVATVSSEGIVTPVKPGQTSIKATLTTLAGNAIEGLFVEIPVTVVYSNRTDSTATAWTQFLHYRGEQEVPEAGRTYIVAFYHGGYYLTSNILHKSDEGYHGLNGVEGLEVAFAPTISRDMWYYDGTNLYSGTQIDPNKYLIYENNMVTIGAVTENNQAFRVDKSSYEYWPYLTVDAGKLNHYGGKGYNVASLYNGNNYMCFYRVIPDQKVSMDITPTKDTMYVGETLSLTSLVKVNGTQTDTYTMLWTSSDLCVATVDGQGTVKAVAGGEAVITATLVSVNNGEMSEVLSVEIPVKVVKQQETDSAVTAQVKLERSLKRTTTLENGKPYVISSTLSNNWVVTNRMKASDNSSAYSGPSLEHFDFSGDAVWYYVEQEVDGVTKQYLRYGSLDLDNNYLVCDNRDAKLGTADNILFDTIALDESKGYFKISYAETSRHLHQLGGSKFDTAIPTSHYGSDKGSFWYFNTVAPGGLLELTVNKPAGVHQDQSGDLSYILTLDGAKLTDYKLNWTVADASVATVSNGQITGIAAGHTDLTATVTEVNGVALHTALTVTVSVTVEAHNWSDATCTTARLCSICGAVDGVVTGHSYQSVVTAPDCLNAGFTTYTCEVCGDSYVANRVDALGHDYEAVVTAPTCTGSGFTTYTCKVCGFSYVGDRVNGLGHSYQTTVTPPTCTQDGSITYTCHCGDSYTVKEGTALGHNYQAVITTAPGCDSAGVKTFTCEACGDSYTESLAATGHSYKAIVTAPTCTEAGFTTYACACGHSYVADEVAALGHTYETVTVDATCTVDGSITNTCHCGDTQVETIPATGHSYEAVVTAPTCTEAGYTTYTCHCGDSYTADEVAALGHSYETVTVDATCTVNGSITNTCHCGDTQVEVIPATGHSYEAVITAPTCTEAGYTTYTCHCGDSYTADEVAALGHSYETVTVDATCTVDGSITNTCHCGDTQVEVIPATGHSFTEGICATCGEVDPDYVKPVVQPTLKLKAPALEFKDMIKVIAFFTAENLDSVVEMGMITYTENVEVVDITTAAHVIPGAEYDAGTGRYYSSSQGIHAKYLGDDVYLAIYAKLSDGSYVYTRLVSYSPITYATNQLKNSTDMNLKQLVAAMLNYGAAAQNYFGYKTDALANAAMTEEQINLPEAYRADMVNTVASPSKDKQGIFANNKGFGTRRPAVSFEGAFSINYFFTPNYTPVDGITMYYWTEAAFNAVDVLTVENASGSVQMSGEGVGQYRGDIEGIAAKSLSEAVYVAAVYSDGTTSWTSGVLGYSIGAYCSSQATKGGTMADLAMATAVYGYHAKAYFG